MLPNIDHRLMGPVGVRQLIRRFTLYFWNWLIISIVSLSIIVGNNPAGAENDKPGRWEFKCPPITDVAQYRKLVVMWTLNNLIWLKIDNGNLTVAQKVSSLSKKSGLGADQSAGHVYTIFINEGRYKFFYNEIDGDFFMTIENGKVEDLGEWQCIITLHDRNAVSEVSDKKDFTPEHVTEENAATPYPYWNVQIPSVADDGGADNGGTPTIEFVVAGNDTGFNNTAVVTAKCSYLVPMLLALPSVIVFAH